MPLLLENPELLRGFRRGARPALEAVYRHYAREVDGYLGWLARHNGCSALGQPTSRSDLLQEVFIRAFSESARRGYDGQRRFAPYLRTIARNCFVDALRRQGREVLSEPSSLPESAYGPQPDERVDPRVLAAVRGYVAQLSVELSAVYHERYVQGSTQEAACAVLGVSRRRLRTSEDHLRRGLRAALVRAGLWESSERPALRAQEAIG